MLGWRAYKAGLEPLSATYSAILLGVLPVLALVIAFEIFVPRTIFEDAIDGADWSGSIDVARYVLFVAAGTMHILICAVVSVLAVKHVRMRIVSTDNGWLLTWGVAVPIAVIMAIFVGFCAARSKLYLLSYERVAYALSQSPVFRYQYENCERAGLLQPMCAGDNVYLSLYAFTLILAGVVATILVCADIGVSHYRYRKVLTPGRLLIASNEMREDINRYAIAFLVVLTSSSLVISIFQQLGAGLLPSDSSALAAYERAGFATSLFWPIAFGAIFMGTFYLPATWILEKRGEALRLLDASEISVADYQEFFAVKQALPQSVRWIALSGFPLAMSLVPRLIEFPS